MPEHKKVLTVAISSRALFNLEDSNVVFETQGQDKFNEHMVEEEKEPLAPGVAFNLVKKLLSLNTPGGPRDKVDVVLLSRNSPNAGMRIMQAIQHYKLDIETAVFTQGKDRFCYAEAVGTDLFLSASPVDVQAALNRGLAAGVVNTASQVSDRQDGVVRLAFDGDSVLFSDEAESVHQANGLAAFQASEVEKANIPLSAGPFKSLLLALRDLRVQYPDQDSPIRIALVTARGVPVHERVIQTLRSWGVALDEAVFCGGRPKGMFLRAFGADIFFDDTPKHITSASEFVASAHVCHGVVNTLETPRHMGQ